MSARQTTVVVPRCTLIPRDNKRHNTFDGRSYNAGENATPNSVRTIDNIEIKENCYVTPVKKQQLMLMNTEAHTIKTIKNKLTMTLMNSWKLKLIMNNLTNKTSTRSKQEKTKCTVSEMEDDHEIMECPLADNILGTIAPYPASQNQS